MPNAKNKAPETVAAWLQAAKRTIDALDAELIAVRAFAPDAADRSWLIAHDHDQPSENALNQAGRMLAERNKGMPLAYILRQKEFYGRKFYVDSRVLIPRPETEALIDLVRELDLAVQPRFLEIGTGSGCIAVTLAREFPQSYVLASDISLRALSVARRNDFFHEGRVDFIQANLIAELDLSPEGEYFDVVVANLPYVSRDWRWVDKQSLRHEPTTALYARGSDGLALYRRFFRELNEAETLGQLKAEFIVIEADPCQHAMLQKIAEKWDFRFVKAEGFGLVFQSQMPDFNAY